MWLCGREGATLHRHVSDFLLHRRDGGVLVVDVKPAQFLEVPEIAAVLAATGRACRARGWGYQVWSGADRTVLANIRNLDRVRRPDVVPVEALDWLGQVSRHVDSPVQLVEVSDDQEAHRLRFLGSPSLRINGQDVEPGAGDRSSYGLQCRIHSTSDGPAGTPADQWILAALYA